MKQIKHLKVFFFILWVFALQTPSCATISHATAQKVLKSVVRINVKRSSNQTMLPHEGSFMHYAPQTAAKDNTETVYGSGFIVTADGHIATSLHILKEDGANIQEINVELHNGSVLPAKIVGYDKFLDVLVLKVQAQKLTPVAWGTSSTIVPTQTVYAFGHPLGLTNSIVQCFVSAINRDISQNEFMALSHNFPEGVTRNIIQLDGNLNPGLSGSAVTNKLGEVIAMTSSNFGHHENGVGIGIGFCVPANSVKPIVNKIIAQKSSIARAELGVQAMNLDEKIMKEKALKEIRGVLVSEVYAESSAAVAGIESGDIILSINGQLVANASQLRYTVKTQPLNEKLPIAILRNGKILRLTITLLPSKNTEEFIHLTTQLDDSNSSTAAALGLTLTSLTPELALEHGYPKNAKGVLITRFIQKNITAVETTLKAGDLLEAIDNTPVASIDDVEKLLNAAVQNKKQSVLLLVNRPEGKKFEALALN